MNGLQWCGQDQSKPNEGGFPGCEAGSACVLRLNSRADLTVKKPFGAGVCISNE